MMYEELASRYDQLVGDDEAYEAYADWVNRHVPGGPILDCACGSGEIAMRLARTHPVMGMDLSAQMVEAAWKKFPGLCWKQGDMTNLQDYPVFTAITCLCDSLNYLVTEEQLRAFFQEVWTHGEWLLFDMHSQDRKEEFAQGWMETGTFQDGTQVQWDIECEDDFLYQTFTFWKEDGQVVQEQYVQRVWHPDVVAGLLDEAGFDIVEISTDLTEADICPGEKYCFVCRRKQTLR